VVFHSPDKIILDNFSDDEIVAVKRLQQYHHQRYHLLYTMQSQSFARALRSAATGSLSAAVSRPAATSRIALAHPALRSWQTRSYASNGNGSADQKDAQADAASEQQSQEAAEFLKKVETLESTVKDLKVSQSTSSV
jgi:hypothetical protein